MPKRYLYDVLGVSTSADPGEIKRAYRRIARAVHPDVGNRPDPARFREAHEAYEILSNPVSRREYDLRARLGGHRGETEPARRKRDAAAANESGAADPSFGSVLEGLARSFLWPWRWSFAPRGNPRLRAVLSAEEARFGCWVPLDFPFYDGCPRCRGTGIWWGPCPVCAGQGTIERTARAILEIPPVWRTENRWSSKSAISRARNPQCS